MIIGKEVNWSDNGETNTGTVFDKVRVVVESEKRFYNTDAYLVSDGVGGRVSIIYPSQITSFVPDKELRDRVKFVVCIIAENGSLFEEAAFKTHAEALDYRIEIDIKDMKESGIDKPIKYAIVHVFDKRMREMYIWDYHVRSWNKTHNKEWKVYTKS